MPDRIVGSPLRLTDLRQKQARSKILGRCLNGPAKFLFGLGEFTVLQVRASENDAGARVGGTGLEFPHAERDGLAQPPQPSILVRSPHGAVRRGGVGRSGAAPYAGPPASAKAAVSCLTSEMAVTVTCPIPFVKTK